MKYIAYYCFFTMVILIFAYFNSLPKDKESFTPKIREMYRPYTRKTRTLMDEFYNNNKRKGENFLKKMKML